MKLGYAFVYTRPRVDLADTYLPSRRFALGYTRKLCQKYWVALDTLSPCFPGLSPCRDKLRVPALRCSSPGPLPLRLWPSGSRRGEDGLQGSWMSSPAVPFPSLLCLRSPTQSLLGPTKFLSLESAPLTNRCLSTCQHLLAS